MRELDQETAEVYQFWNEASCGETLYLKGDTAAAWEHQANERYRLEPFIESFADFDAASGKQVLEVGVGLGADHQRFAEAGALLHGIDLTDRAVENTRVRFKLYGLETCVAQGNAEYLEFENEQFDIYYSWGVLHHSPNTEKAIAEAFRVLKPGGIAKIMIYHKWSIVGAMLWFRYALMRGKPWISLSDIYANYLESPGTKAFSRKDALQLMSSFETVTLETPLGHGDLLESEAGQRHKGALLSIARKIWPRWLIKRVLRGNGLFMLIQATKPL